MLFALKTALLITAIYVSMWDGMIFGGVRAFMDDKVFNTTFLIKVSKPLYGCVICMASFWGGSIYWIYRGLDFMIIEHILLVAGINTLIAGIIYLAYERETVE